MLVWLSAMWALHWGCLVGITGLAGAALLIANQQRIHAKERQRDRRIREEFEAYARLDARLRGDDLREMAKRVCRLVAKKSAFQRVAVLAQGMGEVQGAGERIHVTASIGMDEVTIDALQKWGERLAENPGEIGAQTGNDSAGMRVGERSFAVVLGKESAAMGCGRAIMIPLRTAGGAVAGALALCADRLMTVQRRTVEEAIPPLEALAVKLEWAMEDAAKTGRPQPEKLSEPGLLVNGVAHRLNNPLTAVLGFAELIAETTSETRVRSDAEAILREARRMRQTVQELLNSGPGRMGTQIDEPVELGKLVREMAEECREKLEDRGVRIAVETEDGLPAVHGNEYRLREVLEHLLNNAAQAIAVSASQDEQREHEIRVSVGRDAGSVQVIVSDTGPGFREPERVFDAAAGKMRQIDDGTGAGLSVCYEIVREHGGEISVFNLHPYGAAVLVELPLGESLRQDFSSVVREVA